MQRFKRYPHDSFMPRDLIDRALRAHSGSSLNRASSYDIFVNLEDQLLSPDNTDYFKESIEFDEPRMTHSLTQSASRFFPVARARTSLKCQSRSCERYEEEFQISSKPSYLKNRNRSMERSNPNLEKSNRARSAKRSRLSYSNSKLNFKVADIPLSKDNENGLTLSQSRQDYFYQSPERPKSCVTEGKILIFKDEQERVQKKTFTNWMNTYLCTADPPVKITDLFLDIRDGILLLRILELLSAERLPTEIRPQMQRIHCVSNVRTALEFLEKKNIKLVNINPTDIVDGKPAIVLGLIWTIILYFQIEEQEEYLLQILGLSLDQKGKGSAKKALLSWVENIFSDKYELEIKDFGPSWRDGMAFNAMVHNINPDLVDFSKLRERSNKEKLETAFDTAERHLGIPKLLDPEDVDVERPDEKSIMTYVAQFFKAYPEGGTKQKRFYRPNRTMSNSLIHEDKWVHLASYNKPEPRKECIHSRAKLRPVSNSPKHVVFADALSPEEKERGDYEEFIQFLRDGEVIIQRNLEGILPLLESFEQLEKLRLLESDFELYQQKLEAKGPVVRSALTETEISIGLESWDSFLEDLNQFQWNLDLRLSGDFAPIGRWLQRAERWLNNVVKKWRIISVSNIINAIHPDVGDTPGKTLDLSELSKERQIIFGKNKADQMLVSAKKASTYLKEYILKDQETGDSEETPQKYADLLLKRIKKLILKEPAYSETIKIALARRQFATIIHGTRDLPTGKIPNLDENEGLLMAMKRFEVLGQGKYPNERAEDVIKTCDEINELLNTDRVMEALDQYVEEMTNGERNLASFSVQEDRQAPVGALEASRRWLNDSRNEWTAKERRRLILVFDSMKSRRQEWESLNKNLEEVDSWLRKFDSCLSKKRLPIDPEMQSTVQARAVLSSFDQSERILGVNIDPEYGNLRSSFVDRLDRYDKELHQMRLMEDEKRKQKLDHLMKVNRDLQDGLAHVNTWTDNVAKQLAGDPNMKSVPCTLDGLQDYKKHLEGILSEYSFVNKELKDSKELLEAILKEDNDLTTASQDSRHNEIALSSANLNNTKTKLENRIFGVQKMIEKLSKLEDRIHSAQKIVLELEKTRREQAVAVSELEEKVVKEKLKKSLINSKQLQRDFIEGHNDIKTLATIASTGDNGNVLIPRLDITKLRQTLDEIEYKWAILEQAVNLEDTHLKSFDTCRVEAVRQLNELKAHSQRYNLFVLPITGTSAEIEKRIKLLRNCRAQLKTKRSEFLNPAITSGQILLEDLSPNPNCNRVFVERIKHQMNKVEDEFDEIEYLIDKVEIECEKSLDRWNSLNKQRQDIDDQLAEYEYTLTVLAQGPDSSDEARASMLNSQKHWLDQCKEALENIEKDQTSFNDFVEQLSIESNGKIGVHDPSEIMDRYNRIRNEAQNMLLEASSQVEAYGRFDASLHELKNWLHLNQKRLDDYNSATGFLRRASGHTLQEHRELLTILIENVGESKSLVSKVRQTIEDLARCRSRGSTIAATHAKTEFKIVIDHVEDVERFLEKEQKQMDQQLCNYTEWDVCLQSSEEWLKDCVDRFEIIKKEITYLRHQNDLLNRTSNSHSLIYQLNNLKEEIETRAKQQTKELTLKLNNTDFVEGSSRFETWQNNTNSLRNDVHSCAIDLNDCTVNWQSYGSARNALLFLIQDYSRRLQIVVREKDVVGTNDTSLWMTELCTSAIRDRKASIEEIISDIQELELKKDHIHKMHSSLYEDIDPHDLDEINEKIELLKNQSQLELDRCEILKEYWDRISTLFESNRIIFQKASELLAIELPRSGFGELNSGTAENIDLELASVIETYTQLTKKQDAMMGENLEKNAKIDRALIEIIELGKKLEIEAKGFDVKCISKKVDDQVSKLSNLQKTLKESNRNLNEVIQYLSDLNELQSSSFEWLRHSERKLNDFFKSSSQSLDIIENLKSSVDKEGTDFGRQLSSKINECSSKLDQLPVEIRNPKIVSRIYQLFMDRLEKLQLLSMQLKKEANSALEHETELKNEISLFRSGLDPINKLIQDLENIESRSKRSCNDSLDKIKAAQKQLENERVSIECLRKRAMIHDKPSNWLSLIQDCIADLENADSKCSRIKQLYEAKSVCWAEMDQIFDRFKFSLQSCQDFVEKSQDLYTKFDQQIEASQNGLGSYNRIKQLDQVAKNLKLVYSILKAELDVSSGSSFSGNEALINSCRQLATCFEKLELSLENETRISCLNDVEIVLSSVNNACKSLKEFDHYLNQWESDMSEIEMELDKIEKDFFQEVKSPRTLFLLNEKEKSLKRKQNAIRSDNLQRIQEKFSILQTQATSMQRIGFNASHRLSDDAIISQRIKKFKTILYYCINENGSQMLLWQTLDQEQAEFMEAFKKLQTWTKKFESQVEALENFWNSEKSDTTKYQMILDRLKVLAQEKISSQLTINPIISSTENHENEEFKNLVLRWNHVNQERFPKLREDIEKSIAEIDNINTRIKIINEQLTTIKFSISLVSQEISNIHAWNSYDNERICAKVDSLNEELSQNCEKALLDLIKNYPHRKILVEQTVYQCHLIVSQLKSMKDELIVKSDKFMRLKKLIEQGTELLNETREKILKPEITIQEEKISADRSDHKRSWTSGKFALIHQYKSHLKKIQTQKFPALREILQQIDECLTTAQKTDIPPDVFSFKKSYANLGDLLLQSLKDSEDQLLKLNDLDNEYQAFEDWITQLEASIRIPVSGRASKTSSTVSGLEFRDMNQQRFLNESETNQAQIEAILLTHKEILNQFQTRQIEIHEGQNKIAILLDKTTNFNRGFVNLLGTQTNENLSGLTVVDSLSKSYQDFCQKFSNTFKMEQLKCTGLMSLCQIVQDFDQWTIEILNNLSPEDNNFKLLGLTSVKQVKFDFDIGSNKIKIFKESVSKLTSNLPNEEAFLNGQVLRIEAIFNGLETKLNLLELESSKKITFLESLSKEYEQYRDWLRSWDKRLNQLQGNVFRIVDPSRNENSYRLECNNLNSDLRNKMRDFEADCSKNLSQSFITDNHRIEEVQIARMFQNAQIRLEAFVESLSKMETQELAFKQRLKQAKLWLQQSKDRLITLKTMNIKNHDALVKEHGVSAERKQNRYVHHNHVADCRQREQDLTQFFDDTAEQGNSYIADLTSLFSKLTRKFDEFGKTKSTEELNWCESDKNLQWASEEIDNFQKQLTILLTDTSDAQKEASRILSLWNNFELSLARWQTSTTEAYVRLKDIATPLQSMASSKSILSLASRDSSPVHLGDSPRFLSTDLIPERQDELTQRAQALYDDLIVRRNELYKIKEQAEELTSTSGGALFGLTERLSGLSSDHENLISICREVTSRLELLATEQRSFKSLIEDIAQWISNQCSRLSVCADLNVSVDLLKSNLATVCDIVAQLEQGQVRILKAEDSAERVNNMAMNVSLVAQDALRVVNQNSLGIGSSLVEQTTSLRGSMEHLARNQYILPSQKAVIQQNLSVGDQAKSCFQKLRKQWHELTLRASKTQQDIQEALKKLENFHEIQSNLDSIVSRLEFEEQAIGQIGKSALERWEIVPTENVEINSATASQFWHEYSERYRNIKRELDNQEDGFEDMKLFTSSLHFPGIPVQATSLIERFVKLKSTVQARCDKIEQFQKEHDSFCELANSFERWIVGMSFKLINSSRQNLADVNVQSSVSAQRNVEPNSLVEARNSAQHHAELMREVDTQGKVYQTQILSVIENLKRIVNIPNLRGSEIDKPHAPQTLMLKDCAMKSRQLDSNYRNISLSAESIKNGLLEGLNRWTVYLDALKKCDNFLREEMDPWWAKRKRMSVRNNKPKSSSISISNIVDVEDYPEVSTSIIAGAVSLDDADSQLKSALNKQHRLTDLKRDTVGAGIRCDAKMPITKSKDLISSPSRQRIGSVLASLPIQRDGNLNHLLTTGYFNAKTSETMFHEDDPALVLLADRIFGMMEMELERVTVYIEELRAMVSSWERYTHDRDTFRKWLNGRIVASKGLVEIKSRSSQPEDDERRSLEDFVRELRQNEHRLRTIQAMHYDLTKDQSQNSVDLILDEIKTDFEALVGRMEGRLSRRDQMVTTRPLLYQHPAQAFNDLHTVKGTQTMSVHVIDSTKMPQGPQTSVLGPSLNSIGYNDESVGLRNSGGNRGIARTLWPYDASSSWQDDESAWTKDKPSQTHETNQQTRARDIQQAEVLKQLIRTVRGIKTDLYKSELETAKRPLRKLSSPGNIVSQNKLVSASTSSHRLNTFNKSGNLSSTTVISRPSASKYTSFSSPTKSSLAKSNTLTTKTSKFDTNYYIPTSSHWKEDSILCNAAKLGGLKGIQDLLNPELDPNLFPMKELRIEYVQKPVVRTQSSTHSESQN